MASSAASSSEAPSPSETSAPNAQSASAIAPLTAFATLGTLSTTQALAGTILSSVDGADPELVAEETITLVATATARAMEVALRGRPNVAEAVVPHLLDLPFLYRNYLIASAMIAQQDATLLDGNEVVYERLQRKRSFYSVHLPANQFPGPRALQEKMELWMGRVSPPRLPESPTERLAKLDLVAPLLTHCKAVLAFAQQR